MVSSWLSSIRTSDSCFKDVCRRESASLFLQNFWFSPIILFCLMMSCYALRTQSVVFKTPNNWAVDVTDAPAKCASMICPFCFTHGLNTTYNRPIYNLESIDNEKINKYKYIVFFAVVYTNDIYPSLFSHYFVQPLYVLLYHVNTICVPSYNLLYSHYSFTYYIIFLNFI